MTIKEAIKRCENIRDRAFAVLNSGFGTHENENPLVYKTRVEFANLCIEALRAQQERENPQPSTNADRIRAMDDKAISVLLSAVKFRRECFIKIPDFLSIKDAYKWLQQPAEEER